MEIEMEQHMKELAKTCRLCRRKINLSSHYKSVKRCCDPEVKRKILFLFQNNNENDDPSIHPHSICEKCYVKINTVNPEVKNFETINDIAPFEPHSDTCVLCKIHRLPEFSYKMIKKAPFGFPVIVNKAKLHNFVVISTTEDTCILSQQTVSSDSNEVTMDKRICIKSNFKWELFVWNTYIPAKTSKFIACLPNILNSENINTFFNDIDDCKICIGNEDFQNLITCRMEEVNWSSALLHADQQLTNIDTEKWTIRSKKCELLLSNMHQPNRCDPCGLYRKTLSKVLARQENVTSSAVKKNRPHTSCTKKQLRKKLFNTKKEITDLQRQKRELEKKVAKSVEKKGIRLKGTTHKIVSSIVDECPFPKDSVMHLLWEQQKKSKVVKSRTAMRWHPIVIRWCLGIYLKSPGTYAHIRNTGFLQLPHRTTLNQYTNFTDIGTGYNPDVIKRMFDDFKLDEVPEDLRMCSLLFDEMKIKQGLIFSRHTGKLIGFTELGDFNKNLDDLEQSINDEEPSSSDLATHVLTVMARGVIQRFHYPIGYFSTKTANADELFNIIWDGVKTMEVSGMKVVAFISDGASQNRKFYSMHRLADSSNVSPEGVVYWAPNKFDLTRKIYFFSDPPHLMKTIRNNLEKSSSNGTRNLIVNGKEIGWSHIRNAYEIDLNMNTICPSLRKLSHITFDHIHLTPRLRMRVNLAVQVLGTRFANALQSQGLAHTKETEKFIGLVDQFFDCLNVSQKFEGQKKRKKALYDYNSASDWRFDWLENTFLKYINDWQDGAMKQNLPKDIKAKQCLSYQTLEGIRMTVRSFIELVPQLLAIPGVKYILSDRFNQDPLEEHFGKHRHKGGGSDNPSLETYMYNERKVIVNKSDMVIKGNTRGRKRDKETIDISDDRELPKRPKKRIKKMKKNVTE